MPNKYTFRTTLWSKDVQYITISLILLAIAAPTYPQSLVPTDGDKHNANKSYQIEQIQPVLNVASTQSNNLRHEGFDSALKDVFPMTPDMVRDYRQAIQENEEAILSKPYPTTLDDAVLVSLEPGAKPIELNVAPGLASAIGFHDAIGKPWPIRSYVLGDSNTFQIIQIGENSSFLAISPTARVGWTNLIVALAGEESPLVLKVIITNDRAHFKRSVQIMKLGPNSQSTTITNHMDSLPVAGNQQIMAALTGVGMGKNAIPVKVTGVDALAWTSNGNLYVRSRHTLLSPPWSESLAGPDGLHAYRLRIKSALLFSVDGRIVKAFLDIH